MVERVPPPGNTGGNVRYITGHTEKYVAGERE